MDIVDLFRTKSGRNGFHNIMPMEIYHLSLKMEYFQMNWQEKYRTPPLP